MEQWSNLAKIVYARTYARNDFGNREKWENTVNRYINGNSSVVHVSEEEKNKLFYYGFNRKAMPAGRSLWFCGTDSHKRLGGAGLTNCWFFSLEKWEYFINAQDLLMLGGGVGASVEHKYVSKLPKIKKDVSIVSKDTKDADFIVPDSREGWCELTYRILESYFVTGKSFSYSTVCIRNQGEKINGFGGLASGPIPLKKFVETVSFILNSRTGKHLRPIDVADIMCSIGEMVVAGNVRRSAIIIIGDPWDKEYLKVKRWDLCPIPNYRSRANFSVNCHNIDDLHPLFWKSYEHGEPIGIVNLKNIQTFGRIGEYKEDKAQGVNPCSEIGLENAEPCNLQEIFLPNLKNEEELIEAARLMHRYGKRVTCEKYHNTLNDEVVKRNRRIGTGLTGCLQSNLWNPSSLNKAYEAIQHENLTYSKELNIPESIRTTTIKPSGTLSLLGDCTPGIHPAYSQYYIRRVRFSSEDRLIPVLRNAGYFIEPVIGFDGNFDHKTLVVDFYCQVPEGTPTADKDWDTWKQLDFLKMAQRYWSDNSVSVTIYYKKEEIEEIKKWLILNLDEIKTISFLCHSDHGFKQAPLEAITHEQFEKLNSKLRTIEDNEITDGVLESQECAGGACPIK